MAVDLNHIPFVQAKWLTPASGRDIRFIVMHSMESPEKGDTAYSVSKYFQQLPSTRKASAHYCIDGGGSSRAIVQCVQCKDVAYGAPSLNRNGIHIELAGRARQKEAEWLDDYSKAMLELAAELCGKVLCPKFHIPVQWVKAEGLKQAATRGFTSHAEGSKAFHPSGHWDPGPSFPIEHFLERVRHYSS